MNGKDQVKVDIIADPSGVKKGSEEAKRALNDLAEGHNQAASATKRHSGMALEFIKGLAGYDLLKQAASFVKNLAVETSLLAARQETLGVVLGVVGRNIGLSGAEMQVYADQVKAMGITTLASRESVVRMVQAQMDLSSATKLARIAQDAAVIGNTNSSEAFQRLIYAIQSAQPEMLRVIGLNVNFERGYAKAAEAMGKTVDELTEVEKVQIRTNLVMQAGTTITGAYEGAMGTAGKQLSSLARLHEDLKVTIGQTFQEGLVIAVNSYTDALKDAQSQGDELSRNGKLQAWGRDLINTFAYLGDVVSAGYGAIRIGLFGVAADTIWAMNEVRKAVIDVLPGGRLVRRLLGAATGHDIDAYVQAFRDRVAELRVEDMKRGRNFRNEAEAFFAQSDRERRAANMGMDWAENALMERRKPEDAAGGESAGSLRKRMEAIAKVRADTAAAYAKALADMRSGAFGDDENLATRLGDASSSDPAGAAAFSEAMNAAYVEAAQGAQDAADAMVYTWDEWGNRVQIPLEDFERESTETFTNFRDTGSEAFRELQSAVEGWGRETSRSFARMAIDGKLSFETLGQAARGFAEELLAIQIQRRFMEPWLEGGTRFLDNLFSPSTAFGPAYGADITGLTGGTFHSGGIVGAGGRRQVHPAVFAGAPRLHRGGLAANEMPAILEYGEEVLTRRDPRHRWNGGAGGPVRVELINQTSVPQQASAAQASFDADGMVVRVVLKDLVGGGPIRDAVQRLGQPVS